MLAAFVLFGSGLALPGAWAAWEASGAVPYVAPERVVVDQPAQRTELRFHDGVLAWIEWRNGRPWVSDGTLVALDLRDGSTVNLDPGGSDAIPLSNRTWSPAASGTHVAWLDAPDPSYSERQVVALDLQTRHVRTVANHPSPIIPGQIHLEGSTLTWGTYRWDPNAASGLDLRIHRADLAMNTTESWGFPISDCKPADVWSGDDDFFVRLAACADRARDGLYAWRPGSQSRSILGDGEVRGVDGSRVLWAKRSDGSREEGRGGNIHLLDTTTGNRSRISFSPGAEWAPSISGDLVAWAGSGSRAGEDNPDDADIYFANLTTRNEHRLAGTHRYTAGPVLDGRQLAFGDAEGRLRVATLPSPASLLLTTVKTVLGTADSLRPDSPAGPSSPSPSPTADPPSDAAVMEIRLDAPASASQHWDRDLDGVFETDGPLQVTLQDDGSSPVKEAFGYVVDSAGRVAAMGVDLQELLAEALAAPPDDGNGIVGAPDQDQPDGNGTAVTDDPGSLVGAGDVLPAEGGVTGDGEAGSFPEQGQVGTEAIAPDRIWPVPAAAVAAIAVAGLGTAGAVAAAFARPAWLRRLVPLGLFSRLRPLEMLEHPARRQLADLVAANPGIHYQELVRRVGRGRGVVEHHLASLVASGVVVRIQQGRYVCHFHRDAPGPLTGKGTFGVLKADGARAVLAALGRAQRPGQELAREIGLSPTTVSYHLQRLADAGLVERQQGQGARGRYVVTPAGRRALAAGLAG